MPSPLSPEEEQALIASYYGGQTQGVAGPPPSPTRDPVNFARDIVPPPAAIPYQPNPNAEGYNPNPGAVAGPPPADGAGAVLGRSPPVPREQQGTFARAFSSPEPIFQNPFAAPKPPSQQPIDMGDVDAAVDMGEIDPPREPISMVRENPKIASYYSSGGGSSAKANPDPYGIGAAQKGQLAAMGDRSDALRRASDAGAVKAVQIAEGQRDLGRMQEEDAAIAHSEAEYTKRHFDEGMQEIGRQLDDVKAKKIDPLRMMKEQPALGVLAVIGGALGGFYQGITGGTSNEFLTNLDRQLDRAVAEDERQIKDQKFAIGEAGNLLAQQREAQKDSDLAKLQTRNLQYEAVKQQIAAEATRDDIPVDKARADEMIAQVALAQQQLAEEIGRRKQAQAVAAGAASFAQAKEVRDFRYKVYEKMIGEGYTPAQAEEESRRQVAIQYLGHAGPRPDGGDISQPSMTKEQRGKLAGEHAETERSAAEFNAQVEALKKHPAIRNSSVLTGPLSHLGSRVAPDSAHDAQELKSINMQLQAAVGKMAKDADGKPRKEVQEHIENTYFLDNSDSVPMRLQKLNDARDYVNALARQEGATGAPKPNGAGKSGLDLRPVK